MASSPIHVFARWKIKKGKRQAVLNLLKEVSAQTILEKGNLFYTVHQSQTDANTLILFEGYADEAAQQAHIQSEHYKLLVVEQIVPLLEEREVTLATPLIFH